MLAGSELVLAVTNRGRVVHDLRLDGRVGTRRLGPGQSETVSFGVIDRDREAWCTVVGHRAAGMTLAISAAGAGDGGVAATPAPAGPAATPAIDFTAAPPPGWRRLDPALPPAPGSREHAVTLRALERDVDVAPGVRQRMWTFGGQVPGPVLRGRVGDVFTVTLVNDGSIGHSIDFHASRTPMDWDMRTIEPGQSLVYRFVAEHAGAWMYHCATPPVLQHIGNGMYGALIVDPPDLPAVDREYALVQSELYLGPAGQPGDYARMRRAEPDAVLFNGYVGQYAAAPITVPAGSRVRIWLVDAGPSVETSFHVVGAQFDTVFKEGGYLLRRGNPEHGGAQALDLAPSQGGFVEFALDAPGHYAFVTHRYADADRGAVGTLEVTAPAGSVPRRDDAR